MHVRERLDALREQMRAKDLAAYIVPSTDPHLSEYLPACWERRAYISGFTGSAGDVVVTLDDAGLWTDGRYFLQAERELAGSGVRLFKLGVPGVPSIEEYFAQKVQAGQKVGADPQVLSVARAAALESALTQQHSQLKFVPQNLVDRVWKDRPALPRAPLVVHPKKFAGESVATKLRRIRKEMENVRCDAHVISALDAIMWTLNLRGRDVDFNPVAIGYLLIETATATLFVDPRKVTPEVIKHLGEDVQTRPYQEAGAALRELGRAKQRVWVDEGNASRWIVERLRGASLHRAMSCVTPMKARKNPTEQEGMRAAHRRDGVAMVRFLKWLEENIGGGDLTEMSAAAMLEAIRGEGQYFQGLSFSTISGYAEHGAIIHYSVNEGTDVPLRAKGIYLLDSGAQYLDGTTDITRTLLLGGKASAAQKDQYTRVLMGHIELARAKFPAATRGLRLDTLARMHLWEAGLDYQHGTGHGVGAHLNVHEGPQSIGPRCTGYALEAGNVMSNEPGFYENGSHGIRIENLVMVQPDEQLSQNGAQWLRFETLTLCPIELQLVNAKLLSPAHRAWIDDYHRRVVKELSPLLDRAHVKWLKEKCAAV